MEIERKFHLGEFPDLPLVERSEMRQGYVSTHPVVRIREKKTRDGVNYRLCIKGDGLLARREVEMPLDAGQFSELSEMLATPLVHKQQRVYRLPDGLLLECNRVDEGTDTAYGYAEVEFSSTEQARQFIPPDFLGAELTMEKGFTMSDYCRDPKGFAQRLREKL